MRKLRWILLLVPILLLGNPREGGAQGSMDPGELEALRKQAEQLDPAARARVERALRERGEEAVPEPEAAAPVDDRRDPQWLGSGDTSPAPAAVASPDSVAGPAQRFGHELFAGDPGRHAGPSFGPVPADYRVAPGDEIIVQAWGDLSFRDTHRVDREGRIVLRDAGAIGVAGKTLEQAERAIVRQFSRVLSGVSPDGGGSTIIDVSLGRLRAIRVFVVGEVARPGGYDLGPVSSVFEALYAAGGPSAIGSMRDVRLVRDNRVAGSLDLYDYLTRGSREGDLTLRDGDTVFLPVAGPIVELAGEIRRPALYELEEGEGLLDLLRYGGGPTPSARRDLVHVRRIDPDASGRGDVARIDIDLPIPPPNAEGPGPGLVEGDVVELLPVNPRQESYVVVTGAVAREGRYGFSPGMRLSALIDRAGGLWKDAMTDNALLVRVEDDYRRVAERVSVAGGGAELELAPMDSLHVFSRRLLHEERFIVVLGEVREPGRSPWFEGMSLEDAVLGAGGLRDAADRSHAEISRHLDGRAGSDSLARVLEVGLGEGEMSELRLANRDIVLVRRRPGFEPQREVRVAGEVLYPGTYTLEHRDERLSQVLRRAGGLLDSAFLPGFRFVREQDAVGFISVDVNRALREPGSVHDVVLEHGDRIEIPSRPMSVKVIGEVGFPTSIVYRPGLSISDYVRRAGGRTPMSDGGRIHVIYPSGVSAPVRRFWPDPEVLPGSTVVVPTRDPSGGIEWGEVIVGTTEVLASLATIFLVVDRVAD